MKYPNNKLSKDRPMDLHFATDQTTGNSPAYM